jgi:hypothetical protein
MSSSYVPVTPLLPTRPMGASRSRSLVSLDTTYHDKRLSQRLKNPEFRVEFDRARREIREIDSGVRSAQQRPPNR